MNRRFARFEPHWAAPADAPPELSLAEGLQARITDAAGLLARQWQVGELQGEDASPLLELRATTRSTPLGPDPVEPSLGEPSQDPARDLRMRVELGQDLQRATRALPDAAQLLRLAPLPEWSPTATGPEPPWYRLARLRVPDGLQLRRARGLPVERGVSQALRDAVSAWKADSLLRWPEAPPGPPFPASLSNDAALKDAEGRVVASLSGQRGEPLMAWRFALEDTETSGPTREHDLGPERLTVPGMPLPRWWEMEDEAVLLDSIATHTDDIGRALAMYLVDQAGDDWLIAELPAPHGALVKLLSLRSRDAFFGWSDRDIPPLGGVHVLTPSRETPSHALIPPTCGPPVQGPPLERVLLVRDELANLAWGIEELIEDGAGRAIPRASLAEAPPRPPPGTLWLDVPIPEHYVPFVPGENGTLHELSLPGDRGSQRGRILDPVRQLQLDANLIHDRVTLARAPRMARDRRGRLHRWTELVELPGGATPPSPLARDSFTLPEGMWPAAPPVEAATAPPAPPEEATTTPAAPPEEATTTPAAPSRFESLLTEPDPLEFLLMAENLATVDTLEALRDYPGEGAVLVRARRVDNDGGGGLFAWASGATERPDDGLVVASRARANGRWRRLRSGALSLAWFGAVPNDPRANNLVALESAIAAAISVGAPLMVPAGTYSVALPVGATIAISSGLRVVGAGARSSVIDLSIADPNGVGLQIAAGVSLSLEHLGLTGDQGTLVRAARGSGVLRLSDCRVIGKEGLDAVGGTTRVTLNDCAFTSSGVAVSVGDADQPGLGELSVTRCTFTGSGRGIVVHRSNNLRVTDCTFGELSRSSLARGGVIVGGVGATRAPVCLFRGCSFRAGNEVGIYTYPGTALRVESSSFTVPSGGGGLRISGELHLLGCELDTLPGEARWIDNVDAKGAELVATDTVFRGQTTLGLLRVHMDDTARWRFEGCRFDNRGTAATASTLSQRGGDTSFVDCTFVECQSGGDSHHTRIQSGRLSMVRCQILGSKDVWLTGESGPVDAEFYGCVFDTAGSGLRLQSFGSAQPIVVTGADNLWRRGAPNVSHPALGRGSLQPRSGRSAPLVSATTLTLPTNFNTVEVSGSATITTLEVGNGEGTALFAGPYYLIAAPGASWRVTTTGSGPGTFEAVKSTNKVAAGGVRAFVVNRETRGWVEIG